MTFKINDRAIGKDFPPYIIAELSANHNGSLDRALKTIDEAGEDNKFIFVPDNSVDIKSTKINDINDISTDIQKKIIYFFTHYKDLDPNKWINVLDNKIHDRDTALLILGSHDLFFNTNSPSTDPL